MSWSSTHTKIWTLKQLITDQFWIIKILYVMLLHTFNSNKRERFRRTKMAVPKCPCLTLSNVMFRCQNLIGKSKYHMRRKWLLSLLWSPHTHSYGRDCWLQNIMFIRTCVWLCKWGHTLFQAPEIKKVKNI